MHFDNLEINNIIERFKKIKLSSLPQNEDSLKLHEFRWFFAEVEPQKKARDSPVHRPSFALGTDRNRTE